LEELVESWNSVHLPLKKQLPKVKIIIKPLKDVFNKKRKEYGLTLIKD
jgi:hypothetical protein